MTDERQVEDAKNKMSEAIQDYLQITGATEPGQYIASCIVALRLTSIHDDKERYRATAVDTNFAEASGLAGFAAGFFGGTILTGEA